MLSLLPNTGDAANFKISLEGLSDDSAVDRDEECITKSASEFDETEGGQLASSAFDT